jgi:hypothetical protein
MDTSLSGKIERGIYDIIMFIACYYIYDNKNYETIVENKENPDSFKDVT